MGAGISPVISATLLIAIAVIGSVTVWFWTASYTVKPALAETVQKAITITQVYKNASGDGCYSLDIKNSGGTPIGNAVFEVRDLQTGAGAGMGGMWLQDPGLVSYWNFDGAIGNWTRDSKTGNNGTFYGEVLHNGVFYNGEVWIAGKYGNAVNFIGSNYIASTNDSSLNLRQSGTITAWIKTDKQSKNTIVGKLWNVDPWPGWVFDTNQNTNNGRICFWTGNGSSGGAWQCGNTNITNNAWQHVAISWYNASDVATNVTFYINGTYDGSATMRIPAATNQTLLIGVENSSSSPVAFFNGTIDSLRIWNVNLSQSEIQGEMSSAKPAIRPIAAWEFDEGAGTAANDTHVWVQGKFDSGPNFDKINDYIEVGNSSSLNLGQGTPFSSFSISVWFKLDSLPGSNAQGVVDWGEQAASKRRSIIVWNNQIYFSGYGTSSNLNSGVTTTTGTWYHTAVTVDASKYTNIYVNGELKNASTLTLNNFNFANGTNIGRTRAAPAEFFNGTIDDAAIFNRTLSTAEIAGIYNGGLALSDTQKASYLNVSVELPVGTTKNYNFSYPGNASAQVSLPRGSYILRASSPGYVDQRFTCA